MIPPDEYELALRARDGDREALSELLERARLRLFALAYAEFGHYEDAQDVVAAAVLQAEHRAQRGPSAPPTAGRRACRRGRGGALVRGRRLWLAAAARRRVRP